MGRSPCCKKVGLKKGPWTLEEDQKLLAYIQEHGHQNWRSLPAKAGLQRCGKSCRLRWTNYLSPDIKRGKFSLQEEQTIIQLHAILGNRWSTIATQLPKRTDNEIKNHWNTHLKKQLAKLGIDPMTHKPKNDAAAAVSSVDGDSVIISHKAQWESARLEAEARLAEESKLMRSTSLQQQEEHQHLACPSVKATSARDTASTSSLLAKLLNKMATQPATKTLYQRMKDSKSIISGAILGLGSIESPTSTLSFSENSNPISCVGSGENSTAGTKVIENSSNSGGKTGDDEDWKDYEDCLEDVAITVDDRWKFGSLRTGNNQEPVLNFVEGFTDLLLGDSDDWHHSLNNGDGDSDNAEGTGGDDVDYEGNYWNNIFNVVNTSASESPEL